MNPARQALRGVFYWAKNFGLTMLPIGVIIGRLKKRAQIYKLHPAYYRLPGDMHGRHNIYY